MSEGEGTRQLLEGAGIYRSIFTRHYAQGGWDPYKCVYPEHVVPAPTSVSGVHRILKARNDRDTGLGQS